MYVRIYTIAFGQNKLTRFQFAITVRKRRNKRAVEILIARVRCVSLAGRIFSDVFFFSPSRGKGEQSLHYYYYRNTKRGPPLPPNPSFYGGRANSYLRFGPPA